MSVEQTLAERGKRYGDFTDHARLCQTLKHHMTAFSVTTSSGDSVSVRQPWYELSDVQKQALDVIADKIARILSGDPNYADNWHDIQGYAKLVEDRLSALCLIDNCAVCGIDQNGNPDMHYVGCPNLTATPAFQAEVDATMGEVFRADIPDMTDPTTWCFGDMLECLVCCTNAYTVGRMYKFTRLPKGMGSVRAIDNTGVENGLHASCFKWHSRPAK
jgi:hypothetical protein